MTHISRSLLILFIAASIITSCTGQSNEVGLQLYSVREDMKKDPVATVKAVGEMGYDYVETAGYKNGKIYGMEPLEFKALVEESGMKVLGAHCNHAVPDTGSIEGILEWWDVCIASYVEAGAEMCRLSYLSSLI